MDNSTSGEKASRALQMDHIEKNATRDATLSPTSQFAASLTSQYGDSVVGSKYSPQAGRADKHASNIPGSAKGTLR
jgi:hypothetical protein